MRKAQLRMAVAFALAENGYGPSHYGWFKPGWLEVWDGANVHKLHLPAVKSFKLETLIDRLSVLKPIGDPCEASMPIKLPKDIQIDLEYWIRERADVPEHAAA